MATFTAVFRAIGDYDSAIKSGVRLSRSFSDVRREADLAGGAGASFGTRVARSLRSTQAQMVDTGKSLSLGVTAPLVYLGYQAGKTFAEFEKRIISAGSKTDATAAQLEQMKRVAMDTAAETKFSATEAAEGLDILAAAGFSARDAIGTLPAVTKAAQAQNADLGLTAEVTAKAMNAFNIPVEKAAHVADVFTQAANTTALDMQQLKEALGQVGEVGPRFGQSLEDVVAVTGRLVDLGVPAASAGTAIRQAMTSLAAPTDKAARLIDGLGLELRDAQGEMKPLPDLVEEVKNKLNSSNPAYQKYAVLAKLNETQAKAWGKQQGLTVAQTLRLRDAVKTGSGALDDYAMRTLFGVEGAKAFALAMSDGKPVTISLSKEQEKLAKVTKGLSTTMGVDAANAFVRAHIEGDTFTATSTDAIRVVAALNRESDGTADKIAGIFQKTTAQRAENFKGAIEALAITIFDRLSPALNDSLSDLTDFVAFLTDLSRERPGLVRLAVGFAAVAAAIGPTLFLGGKFLGVIRSVNGVVGATQGALKTAGIWLDLYGEQASGAGRKVRGGLLTNLGKVTTFLGGPWGIAIGLGVTILGGMIASQKQASEEAIGFANSLEYQSGKLAENSRATLAKQLADEGALEKAVKAGIAEKDYVDAIINGGKPREDMIKQLQEIYDRETDMTGSASGLSKHTSDVGYAARDAAKELEKQGNALDIGARNSQQAANASADLADKQVGVADATQKTISPAEAAMSVAAQQREAYRLLNDELSKTADKFTILRDGALSQSAAYDAYKASLGGVTEAVKANRDALQEQVDKGKLSADAAKKRATAVEGDTKAARANRDAIREQVQKLNDKVTADYKANASAGDYVGAQNKARKETKAGVEELVRHAKKAGLDEGAVRDLIKRLVKVPKEQHVDITFSTNAGKVLVKLTSSSKKYDKSYTAAQQASGNGPTANRDGGYVPKRRDGGRIPYRPGAGSPRQDLVMGVDRETGRHVVDVSPEEFVVNAQQTAKNRSAVEAINAGGEWDVVPRRKDGGNIGKSDVPKRVLEIGPAATRFAQREGMRAAKAYADRTRKQLQGIVDDAANGPIGGKGFANALKFAKSQVGKPYIFGSAGPRGYDCSGFMAAIQNVIEGKAPYHRRYSTPSFHGEHAMGFTRGKRSAFMVGVNPNPGRSGHMAGTLQGVNVESAGGVGVRVGGGARGYNAAMFSWRGGLAGGGPVPGRGGDLPFDTLSPSGQRYDKRMRELARKLYGARAYARGTTASGHLTLAGENGAELLRTKTGSQVMTSAKTLDYLSRLEARAVAAPANLADAARSSVAVKDRGLPAPSSGGDVTLNMPMSYVPERKAPTMVQQQQLVRAGRRLRRVP